MNGRSKFVCGLLIASAVASALAPVNAGQNAAAVQQHRENQAREQQELAAPAAAAPQPQPQQQQQAPRLGPPRGRDGGRPPPAFQGGAGGQPQLRPYRGGGNNDTRTYDRNGRDVIVGPPRGTQGRIVPPRDAYVVRGARAPRMAPVLPPAYRSYNWRGSDYYWGGGQWYRPYGGSYVIVGAPLGMFMPYLPGSYSTVWVGGSRYYYADGSYFSYEPGRRGYVVVRSPYRDDDEYYGDDDGERDERRDGRDQDLYIYPTRGQSEQQQADDRYQCHRWAVDQTHYDPTDSEYDRNDRSEYDRAIGACLTGRGYSVK